jgi:uncharacterized protein (DUF58 family)
MVVSLTYGRVLILLSLLVVELLLWIANIRSLFYPTLGVLLGFLASLWLGFPLAFLILMVLVRTVPRVVAPRLVSRHWGSFTTLDLSTNRDDIPSDEKEE